VESKSLKLYLNSLNGSVFANSTELQTTISKDIERCINADVQCQLLPLDDISLHITPWDDLCIDYLDIDINDYTPEASLLSCLPDQLHEETLVSHLLRSLCPVTGQPDWASVRIRYRGAKITHDSLLKYICSFRLHQGFHEQCIERIFCDIQTQCQPTLLSIEGRFTRRGGVDINPFRSSELDAQPTFARQSRQ
jgi:7-cyano-7-deazaguanine reductase